MIFIIIYFLERLGRMHENKTFYFISFNFYFILFFDENQVFNIGFVSLQYKNTN